jgi:hypothetical protein
MANGDITHADIEKFIEFGAAFPESSDTTLTESDVDSICDGINAEVNLVLKRLGFELPSADPDSIQWLSQTKLFGATSLTLDGLAAQNTEEENQRAERYWEKYQQRIQELIESGGDVIDAPKEDDPHPSNVPVVTGEFDNELMKRHLRFPQRAAADMFTRNEAIKKARTTWSRAIKGW